MGAGRTCCIMAIPMLGSLAALVLAIFVMVGSTSNSAPINDLYFLRIDTTNLSVSSVVPDINGVDVSSTVNSIAHEVGISDFYTSGLWNYCTAKKPDPNNENLMNYTFCDKPKAMYWFNPEEILSESLSQGPSLTSELSAVMPEDVKKYLDILAGASKAMFVCYLVGTIFAFLTFVLGWFTFYSRGTTCCVATLALLTFLLLLVSSGISTGTYMIVRDAFNNNLSEFGIRGSLNTKMYGITWGAAVAAAWACFGWFFAICCGNTDRVKVVTEEKQPFIGYVPDPYQPHGHQEGHRI
ncbi:actin cortical patch SUR7/pH-response regulator pali [Yarrowia lipolytica]|nr:hypothetical protein YALI1_B09993g [Yarrowia lipolytica]KAB8281816.1 actin cortical patch SUR7/pH-response regulator pali [Yarrowia lipolytica]KAE8171587.1 actin cortical patch SUR7/pH-response regulator pali [Yarrowia lipolytica]QNP97276.1 SUR7 family protein pun1 [Yarrowia lipolytica]RMJ00946.1 actin cortical patch SUR7/pH-response regulator pali [Yarrowia lipolytica]